MAGGGGDSIELNGGDWMSALWETIFFNVARHSRDSGNNFHLTIRKVVNTTLCTTWAHTTTLKIPQFFRRAEESDLKI